MNSVYTGPEAAKHDDPSTVFQCWDDVSILVYSAFFMPYVVLHVLLQFTLKSIIAVWLLAPEVLLMLQSKNIFPVALA